ncbi:MAG: hypothetical protein A3J58_03620 [Candidatus Sungbacteria bacterium RIFCSPHIGHO2_02_FULL_52_23]|uniref:Uncharacterized protein n=1 Tax=Candidatus Sungbacteria bacterium RIFCSPHIGHO2_02_FULL_52_23 TaxID=1802274 RepID=A0A1G2KVI7_9BACT|nr:MAG: hypothetical protein A3J58_03620 [Candidatus Sungbacteria bacterium RIFCSPHIGHO2_02_FULL_52_23]
MLGQDQSHNLLALFGLADASSEAQEKFLNDASEKILEAVVEKIEQKLPPEKREEFFRLFEKDPPASEEEKAAFFQTYIPDFRDILLAEVERFQKKALERTRT